MITSDGQSVASERVKAIIGNVRVLRKARGWSAQELTNRMTASGCTMKRTVLVNLENGRRDNVTIDELWTFSELFGVPVEQLVVPLCETCSGVPPAGFICSACGAESR